MKRKNPHLASVHCVAHKLALCSSQAADHIPALKEHQQILTELFNYLKASSKRAAKLKQIQELLDDPVLRYKELFSVRWLSYYNALITVYRTIESLLSYFAEAERKDPKVIGLKRELGSDKFLAITYLMMDAMAPITELSKFFQTENLDIALIRLNIDTCLSALAKVKTLESPYLQQLEKDLTNGTFRQEHHVTTNGLNIGRLASQFVDRVKENLETRFPSDDLPTSFSVLAMRPISVMTPQEVESYGDKEIGILCDFYGKERRMKWKRDGLSQENISDPVINTEETREEWSRVKKVVVAEQYPRKSMW